MFHLPESVWDNARTTHVTSDGWSTAALAKDGPPPVTVTLSVIERFTDVETFAAAVGSLATGEA